MIWVLNIIIFLFACYFPIRGFWICKKRKNLAFKTGRLIRENVRRDKYSSRVDLDKDLIYHFDGIFWSFNKWYFHFWVWDLKKMVNNQKVFEEVEKFIEKSERNVLLFKKRNNKKPEETKECQQRKTTS